MSKANRTGDVVAFSALLAQAGVPVIITSLPGTGKSTYWRTFSSVLGYTHAVLAGPQKHESDIGGYVFVENGYARHVVPEWAHKLIEAKKAGRKTLLIIEELNRASARVHNALLDVITSHEIGGVDVPIDALVILQNPAEVADVSDNDIALANRCAHFTWTPEASDFCENFPTLWSEANANIPRLSEGWTERLELTRLLIADFVGACPECLVNLPKSRTEQGGAWPSPRSWNLASIAISVAIEHGYDIISAASSCVGTAAAVNLGAWLNNPETPSRDEVFAHLKGEKCLAVPKERSAAIATSSAVFRYLHELLKTKPKGADVTTFIHAAAEYAARLHEAGFGDAAVVLLSRLTKRIPQLCSEVGLRHTSVIPPAVANRVLPAVKLIL